MGTAERIYNEVRTLPEPEARQVLDFVACLKARRIQSKSSEQDGSVFDRFGAVYEGPLNRDALYDRQALR